MKKTTVVSLNTFTLIFIGLALLIIAKPIHIRLIKNQGNKKDLMYLLLFLLLPLNWFAPRIITVTDCDEYTRDVLLSPAKFREINMNYGKKTYLFNDSDETLIFESVVYGSVKEKRIIPTTEILPNEQFSYNAIVLDYRFKNPPSIVSTKAKGELKYHLFCLSESPYNE